MNKHNIINTNDTYNIIKINKLVKFNDNSYFAKKIEHTSIITNNITRHDHNNYELDIMNKADKRIKHINNYDTEIYNYNKTSRNTNNYYNFYHDTFNFRMN